jgi:hypothetical protein
LQFADEAGALQAEPFDIANIEAADEVGDLLELAPRHQLHGPGLRLRLIKRAGGVHHIPGLIHNGNDSRRRIARIIRGRQISQRPDAKRCTA